MPGRYAPLPTRPSGSNPELDAAFGPDDDDELDSHLPPAPLAAHAAEPESNRETAPSEAAHESDRSAVPAPYDFERDYDYARPPPGSPPPTRPSSATVSGATASSSERPSSFVPTNSSSASRLSFWRRAAGALLPTHYTHRSSSARPTLWGGGTENDGVFSNVTAKPSVSPPRADNQQEPYVLPEEEQTVGPPSYAAAQADAVPSYWETTVHAPLGHDTSMGMIIDDLPTGSGMAFLANMFTSFFFQFVGFLLTYLLHTTHAAKLGSRAGLGLTLIQYGFYARTAEDTFGVPLPEDASGNQSADTPYPTTQPADNLPDDDHFLNITSNEWLSFLLMTLGWFILLSSLIGFWRVKHWESSIRASDAQGPSTPGEIERDISTRRNLEEVFGYRPPNTSDSHPDLASITQQHGSTEARLCQDLRAAGLL